MTALRWGSATDTGLVRRNNQDTLLVTDKLFAVADGMGGHAGGEVASKVAVDSLRDAFGGNDRVQTAEDLLTAVHHANTEVFARAQADADLRGMGTTMTAVALIMEDGEERLAIANVGDSRAYVFTQGELTQLTEDHSVAEELVRHGQLDPAEVDTHPQRHILTRAMGIMPEVDVDLWEVLPYTGDRILLCSDGLVRELTDDQIASVLRRLADPGDAAKDLVARARAAGGSDNITVVLVDVVDDGGKALEASAAITPDLESHPESETENVTGGAPGTFPTPPSVPKRRRITVRVIVFILLLLVVLGGGAAAIDWYARSSYYVGLAGPVPSAPTYRSLAVYKGRPGGFLWFEPKLVETSDINTAEVLPVHDQELAAGHVVSSRAAGDTYIANLVKEAAAAGTTTP